MTALTCWVVTDGKAGMESQCVGLAEALGLAPIVKRTVLRTPWKQLTPYVRLFQKYAFSKAGDGIAPPWPDLVIATGRQSIPAATYVKSVSPKTIVVQIQNPAISPAHFDLVIAPMHDNLSGPNVLSTFGALHRVTKTTLEQGAVKLLPHVNNLPRPYIGVCIGGSNGVYQLTPRKMADIAKMLKGAALNAGGSLLVTPSRRTGEENLRVLRHGLIGAPHYLWDGTGDNPYYGILGLADRLAVTCDSVNMACEAASTGKPVYVIDLPGGSAKFERFHEALAHAGIARPFVPSLDAYVYTPLDDMGTAADAVRRLLAKRAG